MGNSPIPPPPRVPRPPNFREAVIEHLEEEYVDDHITLEELDARVEEELKGDPALVTLVTPLTIRDSIGPRGSDAHDLRVFVDPADHPEWWRWSDASYAWVPVKEIE